MWPRTDTQTDKTFQRRLASVVLAQAHPNHPIQADMCLSPEILPLINTEIQIKI